MLQNLKTLFQGERMPKKENYYFPKYVELLPWLFKRKGKRKATS